MFAAFAFACAVLPSVPALRQDWGPYPFGVDAGELLRIGASGWTTDGMGAPSPYPQAYLVAPLLALARLVLSPEALLVAYLFGAGLLCAFGGRALAKHAGAGETAAGAAALFMTFNPWTFTELVAGHTYMLLAYAATIWLFAEILRRDSRPEMLVLCVLGTVQQIQFFIVATVIVAVLAWRRHLVVPAVVAAVLWLPTAIGIVADRSAFAAIPLTLSWERDQSVSLLGALLLNGYFARYGMQFSGLRSIPMLLLLALAAAGAAFALRQRALAGVTAGTLAALVLATGIRGPLGPLFVWAVEHARAVGVFRELYDLLAFAVIGYAVLALAAVKVVPAARWAFLVSSVALAVLWWQPPPARWWVPSSQVAPAAFAAPPNTRFALFPAFQPLSYEERGSGIDPDMYARDGNVTPLNDSFALYPVSAALAAFSLDGDASGLRALSVSTIVQRAYLREQDEALAQQQAFFERRSPGVTRTRTLAVRAFSELALQQPPAIAAVANRLGYGNLFFGDAPGGRVVAVRASNRSVRADRDWVDARLAFTQSPQLAQGIGGAVTTNRRALLAVRGGLHALVWIDGALRAQSGTVLARTTHGYRWIALTRSVTAVTCDGTCVVAAEGTPPNVPANPPPRSFRTLDFALVTPWLVRARVPAGPAAALRYNVAYDPAWAAYLGGASLRHVRLDAAVNGWSLPRRAQPAEVTIVERVALAQAAAEVVVGVLLLALAVWWAVALAPPRSAGKDVE